MLIGESVAPHGGKLIDRWITGEEALELAEHSLSFQQVRLDARQTADLELLAVGAYSPLQGFMGRADYLGVLEEMRLASGWPWSLPVVLTVEEESAAGLREGQMVALADESGMNLGVLEVTERYRYNKESEARAIHGSIDESLPGVAALYRQRDTIIAGPVRLFRRPRYDAFAHYRLDPAELRQAFAAKGWCTVACHQVGQPIFRATEYLQKCALEITDGLLVHIPVGPAIAKDVEAATHISSTEVLLSQYYPRSRAMVAVLPAAKRGAGARETLQQAIMGKNYGCSHFLIPVADNPSRNGRYRRSVASVFSRFTAEELGISPIFLSPAFYCRRCGSMATAKTCPHDATDHEACPEQDWMTMLQSGQQLPAECVRPEVARLLLSAKRT